MAKVLIIEDDKVLSRVYGIKMEKEGYDVTKLSNGVDAVETAKDIKPDIIILDLMMPEKDGFETMKDLKADADTKKIPVMVVSALGTESDIKKLMDMGAHKYIVKPSSMFNDILKSIEEIISK